MHRYTSRIGVVALAGLLAVITGCGNDDDEGTTTVPDEATDAGDDNGEGQVITVTAVDYAFEDLPDSVAVGTRLDLRNASDDELHELVAVRILDDEERSVAELLELPEEESDAALVPGPPAMVLIAPPGAETATAVPDFGDGTLTEPGRYAIVCFIPTGADPDEFLDAAENMDPDAEGPPEVEGGPPHFVNGMFAELTVS